MLEVARETKMTDRCHHASTLLCRSYLQMQVILSCQPLLNKNAQLFAFGIIGEMGLHLFRPRCKLQSQDNRCLNRGSVHLIASVDACVRSVILVGEHVEQHYSRCLIPGTQLITYRRPYPALKSPCISRRRH